jgi:D-glycero-D-manno-heptose 1,7-bisphosphate phosphatase
MLKNTKLIILDRDGVINYESKDYIKSPDEWKPIPGSLEAIALLSQAGYTLAVATNQSGVGRGLYSEKTLAAIHEKMCRCLKALGGTIDRIFYCPHHPDDACICRKPATGLFEQIAAYYKVDLKGVIAIGDSLRDIQAARKLACQPMLVLTGNGEQTIQHHLQLQHEIPIFPDLLAVANKLLKDDHDV